MRQNRIHAVPETVWAPLAVGLLTLIPGFVALATGQPLLFPSLAPTAALQAAQPQEWSSRFYNTVVGHLLGGASAFAIVLLLGAAAEPPLFLSGHLFPLRMWASVLAVVVTMLLQLLLKAPHPPAFATVLLITLGGFKPNPHDAANLSLGILIVAAAGELVRQLRLIQPGQR